MRTTNLNRVEDQFSKFVCLKAWFHETTKVNKINHRCIQIDRWVQQTCRHRPMDIDATLTDDQTCYYIIGLQDKLSFGAKTTVQCSDQLMQKIAINLEKSSTANQSLVVETKRLQFRKTNNIGRPTLQICCTNQIFFSKSNLSAVLWLSSTGFVGLWNQAFKSHTHTPTFWQVRC